MKTSEFEQAYKRLNTEQKKAVDTIEGPVMVIAGPGTGKTQILTLRIANILLQTDTPPEAILALTFTNAGVYAMRQKLLSIIGDEAYRVNIFTFHSFCEFVMKNFPTYFPGFEDRRAVDDLDKVKMFEKIINTGDFKELVSFHDEFASLNRIKRVIDDIKKEGITPAEFLNRIPQWRDDLLSDDDIYYKRKFKKFNVGDLKPTAEKKINNKVEKAKEIAEIFSRYQILLEERGLYDFHDMVLFVIDALEKDEDLKMDLQEQMQYLLVDEHQDTNDGQNRLIELLTDAEHLDGRANIFTVGDEKQSIYRFQGASEKTFKHLVGLYKDPVVISLKDNYRSTANILDAAYSLITNNDEGQDSIKLSSNMKLNNPISVAEFSNYKFELLYIADDIAKKIKKGVNPNEIAIIYRANKHIDDIKHVLSIRDVPFTINSKDNILDDKNIENIITLLRVVSNPKDSENIGKSLFIDFLNLDTFDTVTLLNNFSVLQRKEKVHLLPLMEDEAKMKDFGINNTKQFAEFALKIKTLVGASKNSTFIDFLKYFLDEIGYTDFLIHSKTGITDIIKLDKIFDEIKRQTQKNAKYSIVDFIKFIDSYFKYNLEIKSGNPEVLNGVRLMTAHGSKGLEFENVYIINSARKNWENQRSQNGFSVPVDNYKGTFKDERRLFYVAMTRAKEHLTISSSKTDWEGKEQEKTQFINEIGSENIKFIETKEFEKKNLNNIASFLTSHNIDRSIWNTEYLSNLYLEKGLNVSALNNYITCPNKYLFRNLIKLPSGYSAQMLYGTLVHKSLEIFFSDSKKAGEILNRDHLIGLFKSEIEKSNMIKSDFDKYQDRGVKKLGEYFDQYSKNWIHKISTEERIKRILVLNSGKELKLSGELDKIEYLDDESEGRINIVDYKTGKSYSQKDREQKAALDRQIIFYHLLMEEYKNKRFRVNSAILDFVEKNNEKDIFEQKKLDVSQGDVNDLKDLINEVSEDILSGEFLNKGCQKKGCEFCRMSKIKNKNL